MLKNNTIKWHLGKNWHKLHPNIQKRFNQLPTEDNPIIYKGIMDIVTRSKAGWLFAFLTKIIGNPLAPFNGKDVPMIVSLTTKKNTKGVFWKRTYYFKNKKPFAVTSVKKEENGKMMECVGAGFGMFLDIYAENSELHFKSNQYFIKIHNYYLKFPSLLCPGTTHVIHADLGNGEFRFTISIDHKFLGNTFYQTGVCHEHI